MAAAIVVASMKRAVTAAKASFAGTRAVVALTIARALIGAGNELASITSVAWIRRLSALADTLNALAATRAVIFAQLDRAVDTTEALVAGAILEICRKLAMLNGAAASEAVGTSPGLVTDAQVGLGVDRTPLVAVKGLAIDASIRSIANTLAIDVVSVVGAGQLFTALTSETSIALADAVHAVPLAAAVV